MEGVKGEPSFKKVPPLRVPRHPCASLRLPLQARLLGTADDVVLEGAGEGGEEGGVTGHADHQILVVFGMSLGVQQGLTGDDVVLDVHTLLIEEAAEVGHELLEPHLTGQGRGMELLIQQGTVGGIAQIQTGHRVGGSRGTLDVAARHGTDTVGDGGIGETAVGGGTGLMAQRHVGGNGIQTRVEHTAAGVGVLQQRLGVGLTHLAGEEVGTAAGGVQQTSQDGGHFHTFEIGIPVNLGEDAKESHENKPPFMVLYYIIRCC